MTASTLTDMTLVSCPKCGGRMWDNRQTKKNAKAPDYKCQNRSCDGVIWPPKNAAPIATQSTGPTQVPGAPAPQPAPDLTEKQKLTKLYLDATEFVLDKVVPKFEEKEIGLSDTAVVAAIATLFIAASKERGQ